jgi:hypothetical protein
LIEGDKSMKSHNHYCGENTYRYPSWHRRIWEKRRVSLTFVGSSERLSKLKMTKDKDREVSVDGTKDERWPWIDFDRLGRMFCWSSQRNFSVVIELFE